ncbi:hypothetical protein PQX77_009924 [Marasmius sp. AFHP31]|nr:hypothetical protein PQX77_009924 [Marasmius sp. AFHP31]
MASKWLSYLLTYPLLLLASSTDGTSNLPTCKFSIGGNSYDLCPIIQHPPFSVAGYIFYPFGSKERKICPEHTWICLNDSRGAVPIASYPPTLPIVKVQDSGLRIQVSEELHHGILRSAAIDFICDPTSPQVSNSTPTFLTEEDGTHSFRWATNHACPIAINHPPEYSTQAEDSGLPPTDQEDGDSENLVDSTTKPHLSARATALTISVIGVLLLTTCYFIYNPPTYIIDHYLRPHLSRLSLPNFSGMNGLSIPQMNVNFSPMTISKKFRSRRRYSRPHNFRVGENRLVQWAQEDLDLEHDVDTMVNAYDDENALLDEYVPLSVGMGWQSRRTRDYGTTQVS